MKPFFFRHFAAVGGLVVVLGLAAGPVAAQTAPVERRPAPTVPTLRVDANATRQELMELLQKHPPAVGRVLKLDPSLMRSESYLAVVSRASRFLHPAPRDSAERAVLPRRHPRRVQRGLPASQRPAWSWSRASLAGLAGLTAAAIVLSTLVWLIRTTLEQRRWSRLSKIQAEVHSKLMDRFSSNDELLTYVQTPSGRRFLESGPSPLQETAPAMAAPISSILWSMQLGAVLLVGGLGMLFLSDRARFRSGRSSSTSPAAWPPRSVPGSWSRLSPPTRSRSRLGLLDRPDAAHRGTRQCVN